MSGAGTRIGALLLGAVALTVPSPAAERGAGRVSAGLVIEEATPAGTSLVPDLLAGSRVSSWQRRTADGATAAAGTLEDPFDLLELQLEQVPRGGVMVRGARNGQAFEVALPALILRLEARPVFEGEALALYERGRQQVESGDAESGRDAWPELARRLRDEHRTVDRCWLQYRIGLAESRASRWSQARAAFLSALEPTPGLAPRKRAFVLDALAWAFRQENLFDDAVRTLEEAQRGRESGGGLLGPAEDLYLLGDLQRLRGDFDGAEQHLRRARERQEGLVAESAALARTLGLMAEVRYRVHDLAEAEVLARRALAMHERLGAETLEQASALSVLGVVAYDESRIDAAQRFAERALAIRQRLAPESQVLSQSLNNLGQLADWRGDPIAAEDYYRRSLAIRRRISPGSLTLVGALANLSNILSRTGRFEEAEPLMREALQIQERLAPAAPARLVLLRMLAGQLAGRERWDEAEALYRRALAGEPDDTWTLWSLGDLLRRRGDLVGAQSLLERAEAQLVPADSSNHVGWSVLSSLGAIYRARGDLARAEATFHRCVEMLGSLEGQMGSGLARVNRTELPYGVYRGLVGTLVDANRTEEAFQWLERMRRRNAMELALGKTERKVSSEREEERRQIDAEYDQLQDALSRLDASRHPEEATRIKLRLQALRERRDGLFTADRPPAGDAAAREPPLDVRALQAALDPGTALLAYSLEEHRTLVFVLPPGRAFRVLSLSVDLTTLGREVADFRALLQDAAASPRTIKTSGAELYDQLIRPVEPLLRGSRRLLVLPDGPLATLPYATLFRREGSGAHAEPRGRFLVEWKPVHEVASGTAYAAMIRTRGRAASSAGRLVAFGDPEYPPLTASEVVDLPLRRALTRRRGLEPLPSTRDEVERIAAAAKVPVTRYLGAEATEERARSLGADVKYLHFACHGIVDEESPLDSGLVLSIPRAGQTGRENGLLQAWEILEGLRFDVELVTLSACGSALGRLSTSEVVGLTRAFQFAGARSVVASLWEVSDASTAELMSRFYHHLFDGVPKDEALRRAQTALLRNPATSHPFHWAAFQLFGDWR
jgi:CHAT domain-containing protein